MRLIDADHLNKIWFDSETDCCGGDCAVCSYNDDYKKCLLIEHQPTIDYVTHGQWIDGSVCSCCGYDAQQTNWDYCGHCGAKMDY